MNLWLMQLFPLHRRAHTRLDLLVGCMLQNLYQIVLQLYYLSFHQLKYRQNHLQLEILRLDFLYVDILERLPIRLVGMLIHILFLKLPRQELYLHLFLKQSHMNQTFLCLPRVKHFAQHRDTHQQDLVISIHKKILDNNNYLVFYYSSLKILLFLDIVL